MSETPYFGIEVEHLRKVFSTPTGFWRQRKSIVALDDVSFNVRSGELFGLLGPNGAGKTTTVKILSTLLLPSAGSARVLGLDVVNDAHRIRSRIGFVFGGGYGLYGRLSGLDNLRYFAELYGLDPDLANRRIVELLELQGLAGRENERVETYSSGMRQRLHLARVLLHDPDVLFLDEPTVGLDPIGARALRRTIRDLIGLGKTVLLTSHYMFEVEELCDRVAIIDHGNILALDTPTALKQSVPGQTVIDIQIRQQDEDALVEQLRPFCDSIITHGTHTDTYKSLSIRTREPASVVREVLAPLLNHQLVHSLEIRQPTLEDAYIHLIQGEEDGV